jgi:hypothetical protein
LKSFDEKAKTAIIEIEEDFRIAYQGIVKLPMEASLVFTLLCLQKVLTKLKIHLTRDRYLIRVSNYTKAGLWSFVTYKLRLVQ